MLLLLLLQRFVASSTCGQQYNRRLLANCRFDAVAAAAAAHVVVVVRVAAGNGVAVVSVAVAVAIAVVVRMGNER